MEHIKVEKIEDFTEFVNSMQVNTYYDLPEHYRYKWIKIDKGVGFYTDEIFYSWSIEYNYRVSGTSGYIFPASRNNKITKFKTENGAKKSLIRRFKEYFEAKTV